MKALSGLVDKCTPLWLTPNRLSWFRIWVIPLVWALYIIHPFLAFALYTIACVSDWLDGFLARQRNMFTPNGKRLDEISDKILVAGVLALLFATGTIHLSIESEVFWTVVVIVVRECIVTTLREISPERAKAVPVVWTARVKTAFIMMALGLMMLRGIKEPLWYLVSDIGGLVLLVAAIFSVVSLGQYVEYFSRRR